MKRKGALSGSELRKKIEKRIYKLYKMKTTEKLTVNLWRILSILPALANPSSSFYHLLEKPRIRFEKVTRR
jgi:hypothetical protein